MDLSDISTVKALLACHGFQFSKSLGQNFIVNPDICPRMAEQCGAGKNTGVLEIGPGIGVLTSQLAKRAGKVVSVELDKTLFPVLKETLAGFKNIKIVPDDILKTDIKQLLNSEFQGMETVVCANLPYYITSPVIMRFLEERLPVSVITVMVQKEAAARLCAQPGSRACGAVSAAVRYYSKPRILFEVPRTDFFPQPNVDSAVIQLEVLKQPSVTVKNERAFFALIKAAFGQRRKTILNSVSNGLALPKEYVSAVLEKAGIKAALRAEQLTLEEFSEFSNLLTKEEN